MIDKVKPGDAVQIKASTWNGFIDAANFAATAKKIGASAAGNTPGSGIVRIMLQGYNDDNDDIMPQYSGVRLETIIVEPSSLDEFTGTAPVFDARPATTENADQPFAILLDATKNGDFKFAVLSGITVAPVNISSAEHKYVQPKTDGTGALESCEKSSARILYQAGTSELQWCVLQLDVAVPVDTPLHGMWTLKQRYSEQTEEYYVDVEWDSHPEYTYCGQIYDLGINVNKYTISLTYDASNPHYNSGIAIDYINDEYRAYIVFYQGDASEAPMAIIKIGEVEVNPDGTYKITMINAGVPIRAGDYFYV